VAENRCNHLALGHNRPEVALDISEEPGEAVRHERHDGIEVIRPTWRTSVLGVDKPKRDLRRMCRPHRLLVQKPLIFSLRRGSPTRWRKLDIVASGSA
jgi:hypothetical protein